MGKGDDSEVLMGNKPIYAEKARKIIDEISELASLPNVAVTVIQKTLKQDCDFNQIADIIETDPALTKKVLRVANSPFYGRPTKISTIKNAIVVLGLNTLKSIVLTISVMDSFKRRKATNGLDRDRFWSHSLACAITARLLCEKVGKTDPDEAFMAGILHDVGVLIYDQYLPSCYSEALNRAVTTGERLQNVERELFGLTHGEMGRKIMEKWQLPDTLARAVEMHHDDFSKGSFGGGAFVMGGLLQVADCLCEQRGYCYIEQPTDIPLELLQSLGLEFQDLAPIKQRLPREVAHLSANLSIKITDLANNESPPEEETLLARMEQANAELGRITLELNKALAEITFIHQISQEITTAPSYPAMFERAGQRMRLAFNCTLTACYLQGRPPELFISSPQTPGEDIVRFVIHACREAAQKNGSNIDIGSPRIRCFIGTAGSAAELKLPVNHQPEWIWEPLVVDTRFIGVILALDLGKTDLQNSVGRTFNTVATHLAMGVQKSRLDQVTRWLSITDDLTRLPNHRHLRKRFSEEMARAQRYNKDLSVMLLDIDHFKKINDTHGHQRGDQVLRELSARIRSLVRQIDIAGRYGGEEFMVITPETGAEGAFTLAERIRDVIGCRPFGENPAVPVTISAGVASLAPGGSYSQEEMIKHADQALYHAKRIGRNRVCAWQPDLAEIK